MKEAVRMYVSFGRPDTNDIVRLQISTPTKCDTSTQIGQFNVIKHENVHEYIQMTNTECTTKNTFNFKQTNYALVLSTKGITYSRLTIVDIRSTILAVLKENSRKIVE